MLCDIIEDSDDGCIAEKILDYNNVNKKVFRKFLDIAMPACALTTFVDDMKEFPEPYNRNVTVAEEAFALLVLENNYERWCHIAADKEGRTPKAKWMKEVSQGASQKTKNAAGNWTDDGLTRYNKIIELVQVKRGSAMRRLYMESVKKLYEDEYDKAKKRRKRKDDNEDGDNVPEKKRVRVKNLYQKRRKL